LYLLSNSFSFSLLVVTSVFLNFILHVATVQSESAKCCAVAAAKAKAKAKANASVYCIVACTYTDFCLLLFTLLYFLFNLP